MKKLKQTKIVLLSDSSSDDDDDGDQNCKKSAVHHHDLNDNGKKIRSSFIRNTYGHFLTNDYDNKIQEILANDCHHQTNHCNSFVNGANFDIDSSKKQSEFKENGKIIDTCQNNNKEPVEIIELSDEETKEPACESTADHQNDQNDSFIMIENEPEIIDNNPTNSIITIRIKRLTRIERFRMLRSQTFSTIFDEIAQRFDIPVSRIILYLDDSLIDAKSTPQSIDLSIADIFELFVRSDDQKNENNQNNSDSNDDTTSAAANNNDPNILKLYLRDRSNKKRLPISVNRFEMVKYLYDYFIEQRPMLPRNIQLKFDDETLDLNKKIDEYDLENDDQIDVLF